MQSRMADFDEISYLAVLTSCMIGPDYTGSANEGLTSVNALLSPTPCLLRLTMILDTILV